MTLTNTDYQNIANEVSEGLNTIEYEKDGEVLIIDYEYSEDGYREEDTNAYIVTERYINAFSVCFRGDEEKECDFDDNKLLKFVA